MERKTRLAVLALALIVAAATPARASGPEGAGWSGKATSRARTGVVAVWSETRVAISRDEGRTFQKLKTKFENIEDVVVGASGTVFVLDGKLITMAFARGHVRRVPVPQTDTDIDDDIEPENIRLAVGGGYLAFVSRAGVALSRDHGASWQFKEFPDGWADAVELTIERDGTFDAKVTIYNCHSGDYDLFYRGSVAGSPTDGWRQLDVVIP